MDQVEEINRILNVFKECSGQTVNKQKSSIFFSKNVHRDLASDLSSRLGIPTTNDISSYLGFQVLHTRKTKFHFSKLVERVKKKLNGWKARSLSFAGRVTLAQACIMNLPSYIIQATILPVSICDEFEKICRDFIWGSTPENRKAHLLSWSKICTPKSQGGLGFRNIRVINQAYFIKLGWTLINEPNKLWVQVIKAKYNCGAANIPSVKSSHKCSHIWRGLVNVWNHVVDNICWDVKNGHSTRFWSDNWIPGMKALSNIHGISVPQHEKFFPVSAYASADGWRWDMLNYRLPHHICAKIAPIPPPNGEMDDIPIWKGADDGSFSIGACYLYLANLRQSQAQNCDYFKLAWNWNGPQRVRIFLWKLFHNRLLTNSERKHRHMTDNDECPKCLLCPETLMHALRDCDIVREFWSQYIPSNYWAKFFSLGTHEWLVFNLADKKLNTPSKSWASFFGLTVYHLWNDRNDLIFNRRSKSSMDLHYTISAQALLIHKSLNFKNINSLNTVSEIDVSWRPPLENFYKVNVDGSYKASSNMAACGGLVRDHYGRPIKCFTANLGYCNALWAELWGLKQGIKVAIDLNIQHVLFEMDSLAAVQMIKSGHASSPSMRNFVIDIRKDLLERGWLDSLTHIFRSSRTFFCF